MYPVWVLNKSVNIQSSVWASWCQRFKYVSASWTAINFYLGHIWVSDMHRTADSLVRLFAALGLSATSENKQSIEWVTTKFVNVYEIIIYHYWFTPAKGMQHMRYKRCVLCTSVLSTGTLIFFLRHLYRLKMSTLYVVQIVVKSKQE